MEKVWLKNYPKGVNHEINPNVYKSIVDVFNKSVDKYNDKIAYKNMGASITFSELDELTNQFAGFLQKQGLKKGDRIAIQLPNLLQFPVVLFGALKAGLIVVNTNPLYTAREMKYQFVDSGAKAIVVLSNFASQLEEVLKDTKIETVVVTQLGDMLGWPKSHIVNFAIKHVKKMVPNFHLAGSFSLLEALDIGKLNKYSPLELGHEDLAFLQYTGGTTGVSKGAMLTHKNIIANMLQVKEWIATDLTDGEEVVITALPLYHIFSLTVNCLCFLKMGGTNVLITNPKDIPGFIKTLKKEKFTLFTGVNTLFNALANHPDFTTIDFSHLKFSVAGGMALQRVVAELWQKKTNTVIYEGFGLTETSPVACVNPLNENNRVGSIGMPVPSTEVKVIDEEGVELGFQQAGELCIKGPQVMKGYWQRPDETEKVMLTSDWLKTGDIAEIMEDGFVKIVDRKKDMILVSGFNVYPNEVEDIAVKHPAVLEAAAVGIPDEKSTEAVKLFVVLKPGHKVNEQELKDFCRQDLVNYKIPKHIEFRSELPKTNVGKILRRALREV
ncbi:MAG: AMP-binding protein [Bdellovibrionaceae bacterium]|nr:AMP-binding protein [Pseudobdellovibrionaceae bacterium]